jgi:hypothetical protein
MSDPATSPCLSEALRCATYSRVARLDPVGTTGSYEGYLLADVALPWPPDLATLPEVGAVQSLLEGTGIRFQATVPIADRRVALYRRRSAESHRPSPAPDLVRTETAVAEPSGGSEDDRYLLTTAVERLMAAPIPDVSVGEREVFVCTHGSRDACCGSRGSRLHQELVAGPEVLGAAARVRRTSHTGGHRFAPTAIILPDATAWAYLDVDVLRAVVTRTGPVAAILGHYRGWAGLGSPRLQALERAVLAEIGWDLFDRPRWGDEHDGRTRLTVGGDAPVGVWEATVTPGRRLPRPDCGAAVSEAGKTDTELVVHGLRRVN